MLFFITHQTDPKLFISKNLLVHCYCEIHYVDFTPLAGLSDLLKEEKDVTSFVEAFKLRTRCMRLCPKPSILGVEFLVHATMGSGLLVFEAPRKVELLQVEDILDPLEIPVLAHNQKTFKNDCLRQCWH